jgi:shikimate kinase
MKIFIIGFMASGKTTIGRELANALQFKFIDLDDFIESRHNQTIKQLFEFKGEDYFRKVENEALKEVCDYKDDYVISAGGGTSCFYNNIDFMNRNGITVYLRMEVATLVSRLIESKIDRPLLWGKTGDELADYILRVLDERKKFYDKAQLVVDGDNLNPAELAQLISAIVREEKKLS